MYMQYQKGLSAVLLVSIFSQSCGERNLGDSLRPHPNSTTSEITRGASTEGVGGNSTASKGASTEELGGDPTISQGASTKGLDIDSTAGTSTRELHNKPRRPEPPPEDKNDNFERCLSVIKHSAQGQDLQRAIQRLRRATWQVDKSFALRKLKEAVENEDETTCCVAIGIMTELALAHAELVPKVLDILIKLEEDEFGTMYGVRARSIVAIAKQYPHQYKDQVWRALQAKMESKNFHILHNTVNSLVDLAHNDLTYREALRVQLQRLHDGSNDWHIKDTFRHGLSNLN